MKADIHPNYRPVIFEDVAGEFKMLVSSTIPTKQTAKWDDGEEYPYVRVDISAASHPFFTGKQKFVDTAGRVERFQKRFGGNYFGNK